MKEFTIDDFEIKDVIAMETGRWSDNPFYSYAPGKYDANLSSILTFLIQKAGRICEHYASDLFITWKSFDDRLCERNYSGEKILFGFRGMGVDSNTYVLSRLNNYGLSGMKTEIKELYMLEVKVNPWMEITFTLGTVNEDKFRQFITYEQPFPGRSFTFDQMHEVYRDMVHKKEYLDFDCWLTDMLKSGVFKEV